MNETNEVKKQIKLPEDAHFARSIEKFLEAFENENLRNQMYKDLLIQAKMVEDIKLMSKR